MGATTMAATVGSPSAGDAAPPPGSGAATTSSAPRSSPLAPVIDRWRAVEKRLARHPVTRLLGTVPNTGGFAVRTLVRRRRNDPIDGFPEVRLTPKLLGSVALDEAILLAAKGPDKFPRRADYERVGVELREALDLFRANGWLDDPATYHRTPPPLAPGDVETSHGWAHRLRYERLRYPSEFAPRDGEPGRDRWMGFHSNRTAGAWVLRHDDGPRPWVVCVHGFGMGYAFMEFPAFHAAHLHHDLGLNLIGPTLPLHGHRKVSSFSGDQFLSFDIMNAVHGLTQSIWDVRRALNWVRAQEPTGIAVSGISLGGCVTSLVAATEPDLDAVIAGVPVSDFPALFESQSPAIIRHRAYEHGILGGPAAEVHRVVSPLVLPPVVPHDRRFIFAGIGDRMAHPRQAHNLWKHWDEPRIRWYAGNHIGFLWSPKVEAFVDEVLRERGLVG